MEEWKEYKLAEVCENIYSGGTPSSMNAAYWNGNLPWLSSGETNQRYIYYTEKSITQQGADNSSTRYAYRGSTVIASAGQGHTRGQASMLCIDTYVNQSVLVLKPNPLLINPHFLYFNLDSRYNELRHLSDGTSTRGSLSGKILKDLKIYLPSLNEQNKIASILKSLDDKIEVNRRINENLEQQAQALFKSWFVDFEPFKNGEFVESELGMIPKGWRVGKLGELCQFKRGKGLLSKNAIPGNVPVVAGGLEPACYHNVSNTKAPVITVSGSGANAGFMRMYHQEVWASDCSFIDVSCENWLFVYCFLAINSHLLKHAQTGAVQPHVKPADIHYFDLVIPPKEIIQRFQDKISSFIAKKGLIEQESRRLAEIRDTLLPKLMSGELKVNDIEKAYE